MSTVTCFQPLLGKRIRVTSLDECGNFPAPGTPDAYLATNGFITISLSSEVEEGAEIVTKKADGSLCVNEKFVDSFKRFTVEIEFCGVNPALLSMMTNAEPYVNYKDEIAGFTVPEGDIEKQFALELWTGLAGQACEPGAESAGGYMLLPFVQGGVIGDVEIGGEDAISFSLTGSYTKGGNGWGVGPYNVMADDTGAPAPLPTPLDPYDHLLMVSTTLAPPPSACDPQVMPTGETATGAVAGTPGTFTPEGSSAPADSASGMLTLVADPATPWETGQYVAAGDGTEWYWDGESWTEGRAPTAALLRSRQRLAAAQTAGSTSSTSSGSKSSTSSTSSKDS